MSTSRHTPARTRRLRLIAGSVAAGAVLAGGAVASAGAAQAYDPCNRPNPPDYCDTPVPTPVNPYYSTDQLVPSRAAMPVNNGSAEHVSTTVTVRRKYLRATGQQVGESILSAYHVQNDLALAGFHVTVYEQLYSSSGAWLGNTGSHTLGVTPKLFDPAHATLDAVYVTSVPVGFSNTLANFQPVDSFSN
ncbi:hypothetical protein G7075_19220 [Phycicoccus sp. HDW14]|uniref:hypothetical protein n=1 Tax=Phycicoccus sp. HDW14 TaxID=2714941 RepID=UPI001407F229|nr:hypothetical protein [Phycicoccus sp. HDW14]QIM22775.1 hypothetical protein G7075_19220 [Phycicoccus sp. HDW14]